MAYTVEQLAGMIVAPEPVIEDYYENGAYDEASFFEAMGAWQAQLTFARQMLDLITECNRLTAANGALQAKIDAAMAITPYSIEDNQHYDDDREWCHGYNAAIGDFHNRLDAK